MKKILSLLAILMTMMVTSVWADEATTPNYFCITAGSTAADVKFVAVDNDGDGESWTPEAKLEISTDATDSWAAYTYGTPINITAGGKLYFRAAGTDGKNENFSESNEHHFEFTSSAEVSVSGSIMSLLDASCTQTTVPDYAFCSLFNNCQNLTSVSEDLLPATTVGERAYNAMFYYCTGLTEVPEKLLPATTLGKSCYASMFNGCKNLTKAPGLGENVVLANACCELMFSGCTNLVTPPALNAATLADECYHDMFESCTSLTLPETYTLPATTLAKNCYQNMFESCTSITAVPAGLLPATTLASDCYDCMFRGCTSLTTIPENLLPAEELANNCYASMFDGCTSLTTIPENLLPAKILANTTTITEGTSLAENCYSCMFYGCTSLENAPKLPATILAASCYADMFNGCIKLKAAPELKAMAMASGTYDNSGCYERMFLGCKALTAAPKLPATELANECYSQMFTGCTGLTQAPELPATKMADNCYNEMFSGCTSLAIAPVLASTELAYHCYDGMFKGCTSLVLPIKKEIPTTGQENDFELPATTLATGCYADMFNGCTSITKVPTSLLPATALADKCYDGMFSGCTSLTAAPLLPAITLVGACYEDMFNGCSKLANLRVEFTAWGNAENDYNKTKDWLKDAGTDASVTERKFIAPEDLTIPADDYRTDSNVPKIWTAGNPTPLNDGDVVTENGTYYVAKNATGKITINPNLIVTIKGRGQNNALNNLTLDCGDKDSITIYNMYVNLSNDVNGIIFEGDGKLNVFGENAYIKTVGSKSVVYVGKGKTLNLGCVDEGKWYSKVTSEGCATIGAGSTDVQNVSGNVTLNSGYWFMKAANTSTTIGNSDTNTNGGLITFNAGHFYAKGLGTGSTLGGTYGAKGCDITVENTADVTIYQDNVGGICGNGNPTLKANGGIFKLVSSTNALYGNATATKDTTCYTIHGLDAGVKCDKSMVVLDYARIANGSFPDLLIKDYDGDRNVLLDGTYKTDYITNEVKNPVSTDGDFASLKLDWLTNENKEEGPQHLLVNPEMEDNYPTADGSILTIDQKICVWVPKKESNFTVANLASYGQHLDEFNAQYKDETNTYVLTAAASDEDHLNDAISHSWKGETVTLIEDFGLTKTVLVSNKEDKKKDVTIDLHKHTVTGPATAGTSGGAFYNGDKLTIKNGTIKGGNAEAGGAIFNDATMAIENVTLTGNKAVHGSAIYNQGKLDLSDITVTGNTATKYGAVVTDNSDVTLKHNIVIKDNTATDDTASNLFVVNQSSKTNTVTLDSLKEDSNIGVTAAKAIDRSEAVAGGYKFTSNGTADDAKYFFSDNDKYGIIYNKNGKCIETIDKELAEDISAKVFVISTFENNDGTSREEVKALVNKDFGVKVTLPAKDTEMYANKITTTVDMKGVESLGFGKDEKRSFTKTYTSSRAESIILSDNLKHVYEFEGEKHVTVKVGDVDKFTYTVKFATQDDGRKIITATPSDTALARKAWGEIASRLETTTDKEKPAECGIMAGSYVKNNNEMIKFIKDATFTAHDLRANLQTLDDATRAYTITDAKLVEFALAPESYMTIGNTSIALKPEKAITVTVVNNDSTAYVSGNFLKDMKTDLGSLLKIEKSSELKKQIIKDVLGYMKTIDASFGGKRNVTVTVSFDENTGISELTTHDSELQKDGKFLENGRVVIVKNGMKFNANGQRMK